MSLSTFSAFCILLSVKMSETAEIASNIICEDGAEAETAKSTEELLKVRCRLQAVQITYSMRTDKNVNKKSFPVDHCGNS